MEMGCPQGTISLVVESPCFSPRDQADFEHAAVTSCGQIGHSATHMSLGPMLVIWEWVILPLEK